MSGAGGDLERDVSVLREALETLAASLGPGSPATACLSDAIAALARFEHLGVSQEAIEVELVGARRALEDAERRLGSAGEEERAQLAEAEAFLAQLRAAAVDRVVAMATFDEHRPAREALAASVGRPQLHEGVRVPSPALLAAEPPWEDADGDDDTPQAPSLPAPTPLTGLAKERADLARAAIEEIASMSTLRGLFHREPWADAFEFEQRLLDNFDYLVALDRVDVGSSPPAKGVLEILWEHATTFVVPDAGRAFALGFFLSSIAPHLARSWLRLAVLRSDARCRPALAEAMALGASPEVAEVALALLRDSDEPDVLALSIDVLIRRRVIDLGLAATLTAHPSPRVVARAARWLVHAPRDVAPRFLTPLLEGPEEVATEALESLAVLGERDAFRLARLRAVTQGEAGLRASELLAFRGDEADRELLLGSALADPARLHILGIAGFRAYVEPLQLAVARETDVERAANASFALDLITGGQPAPDRASRLRRGRPHAGIATLVADLADPRAAQGARRLWARELAVLTGQPALDVDGWAGPQRERLSAMVSR